MNRKPFLIAVWTTHRYLLIGLIGLLALNVLLILLIHYGISSKLSQTEKDLTQLQQQLRRGDSIAPQQAFEQGEKDYARFNSLLPSLRNFSELIGDLYTLANSCNLEISQINYTQKSLPDAAILSYSLKFSLTGTYGELKRFIYGLEEFQRLIVIDQINFNSAKSEAGDVLVTLSLNLTTYFRTEETE